MSRRLITALALALTATGAWAQGAPPSALPQRPSSIPTPGARRGWDITLFQIDKASTLVGNPIAFPCTPTGCEQPVTLDIAGRPFRFLIAVSFVPKGAYFAVQPLQPDVTRVIEFEKTYLGPTFLQVREKARFNTTLRFTLVGPAMRESEEQPGQIMNNQRSKVFQRKLSPDLILRVSLAPAAEGELKPVE